MMKLLDRTRSDRRLTRHDSKQDSVPVMPMQRPMLETRPSLAYEHLNAGSRIRQDVTTIRPQTADAGERYSKALRMSFFEAFAIDAGNDTFAFPKPSSAKTTPSDVELIASLASSRDASPMIGVAYGSPSHPPLQWTRLPSFGPGSANATPRTPRFVETFTHEESPKVEDTKPLQEKHTSWKRFGSLFRKNSKGIDTAAKNVSPSTASTATLHNSKSPRPKSRGRLTLTKEKRAPSTEQVPQVQTAQSKRTTHSTKVKASREDTERRQTTSRQHLPSKQSRVLGADDATLRSGVGAPRSQVSLPHSTTPVPRIELRLPSYHMERYSVMFEKVLDPKPSLLERRKSRLRLLDSTLEEQVVQQTPTQTLTIKERTTLIRSLTSPSLSPSFVNKDRSAKEHSFQAPALCQPPTLYRSNTMPVMRDHLTLGEGEQAEQAGVAFAETQHVQLRCERSESPNEDDLTLPLTPPSLSSDLQDPFVHIVADSGMHLDVPVHKETSNVWQSVLPAPPGSSTSSRFSIDVHRALDSPKLLHRSQSYSGITYIPKPVVRQVQVAVAQRVSFSRARHAAQSGDTHLGTFRPRVIEVGLQAHARKTLVLDTDDGIAAQAVSDRARSECEQGLRRHR